MSFDAAFIGYHNRVHSATLTASNVTSGYSVNSLKNWQPFSFVSFDAGWSYIDIDCGAAASIDYFAIGAHELFTTNTYDIYLVASNDPSFATYVILATIDNTGSGVYDGSYAYNTSTSIPSQAVEDNHVVCLKLDPVSYRYYRLEFIASDYVRIAVLALGLRTEFELGFYKGIQPPKLNEDIVVTNNKSESGVYLGRSIVRTGVKPTTINLDKMSHSWLENTWLPFKKHAEVYPFFYSFGNTPLYNNQLCYQTSFAPVKFDDRIGGGHGSCGITFEGVIK
jgi:hypothetical protein